MGFAKQARSRTNCSASVVVRSFFMSCLLTSSRRQWIHSRLHPAVVSQKSSLNSWLSDIAPIYTQRFSSADATHASRMAINCHSISSDWTQSKARWRPPDNLAVIRDPARQLVGTRNRAHAIPIIGAAAQDGGRARPSPSIAEPHEAQMMSLGTWRVWLLQTARHERKQIGKPYSTTAITFSSAAIAISRCLWATSVDASNALNASLASLQATSNSRE